MPGAGNVPGMVKGLEEASVPGAKQVRRAAGEEDIRGEEKEAALEAL